MAAQHKDKIIALARHAEAAENPEHPMNRIAGIELTDEGLVIATTDIHLPRRIGNAIKNAYGVKLDVQFDAEHYLFRACACLE